MKYFIDTEFIEGFHKPLFGKKRHFIDLISIGIYAEDGRTYYAISNEFNPKDADQWVKDNVLKQIEIDFFQKESTYAKTYHPRVLTLKNFIKWNGKSNKQVVQEIIHFTNPDLFLHNTAEPNLEFYGYYSDYDWVLFCSLFGRMIDLPKGFPMYCRDLKQMFDEKQKEAGNQDLKSFLDYPKQTSEHNALADAKWNFELYKFLNTQP